MFEVSVENGNLKNKWAGLAGMTHKGKAYAMSQFAAAVCTNSSYEKAKKAADSIDVNKVLFKPGHHTTMQHGPHHLTYHLGNIPVSLVTFGLHLHPFYNTSQCSGRYCTDLFGTNDRIRLTRYIEMFLRQFGSYEANSDFKILEWAYSGIEFFNDNISQMTKLVAEAIKKERPFYTGNIELQASRIAQEQLRGVISTIVPTHLVYTINIPTLMSLYKEAWNPPLRILLNKMLHRCEDTDFDDVIKTTKTMSQTTNNFVPAFLRVKGDNCITDPSVVLNNKGADSQVFRKLLNLYKSDYNVRTLNTLPFNPNANTIDSLCNTINTTVEIPVSTFGQDQRHRTIDRSNPVITGGFYVPPLVRELPGGEAFCNTFMRRYLELCEQTSNAEMIHFIPYGAMVRYTREADVRAYLHCINKRLCWSAELTISNMERQTIDLLREEYKKEFNAEFNLRDDASTIDAPCFDDRCHEGGKYCGRDLGNIIQRELI